VANSNRYVLQHFAKFRRIRFTSVEMTPNQPQIGAARNFKNMDITWEEVKEWRQTGQNSVNVGGPTHPTGRGITV